MKSAILRRNIPAELHRLMRWCLWRRESRIAGEAPTKVPYDAQSRARAKSSDPSTWPPFTLVCHVFDRSTLYAGVGFVLDDDAPYVGVDLDDCRDPSTGRIHPRAAAIVERFGTYTEISQSARGVKLIGRGAMP